MKSCGDIEFQDQPMLGIKRNKVKHLHFDAEIDDHNVISSIHDSRVLSSIL